jgi:hypothetical protein
MAKFLIEVPHEPQIVACARAIDVFLKTGSHFLTHADYGCSVGEHKAWLTVDVASEQEARAIVPPAFRDKAKVVQLIQFSQAQINHLLRENSAGTPGKQPAGEEADMSLDLVAASRS